ncbi:hypothetical protein LXL04_015785 [Taraxacum kok-saghyz]
MLLIEEDTEEEEIDNLDFIENDYDFLNTEYVYNTLVTEQDIDNLISKLEKMEIIGENVLKYWENDKVVCELKIKNPEYIIRTKNIEPTNEYINDFKLHISELLKLGVIRKSDSPQRSAAFIVRKHSEIVREKSRMVINYKRLNDNTIDDSYNIPDKNVLINRIQNCKIFSKFDLKSGFWQIKMHPNSIEWTAFTCPEGHFEWLVMSFGLKNAPSIFQRKMEDIFNKHKDFAIVYIDDILVFSKNRQEHRGHLQIIFSEFIRHGLIITQKALEFPDKLEDLKFGKIAGPLYSKTSITGQIYFNQEDVKLVQTLKEKIKNLPELALPLDTDYLIIETDGCSQGWGAVLCCKPNKFSEKSLERICRYNSGKYKEKGNISSIDAELLAISYALDSFELFIISKKEITLRTDCETIVSFYNKMNGDRLTINIEHIKGKGNKAADILSRSHSDSLKHYTESPVTYSVTRDTNQILFCDHCETMKNNYKILNEEIYKLRNEKQDLVNQINSLQNNFQIQQQAVIEISSGSSSDPNLKSKKGTHSPMSDTEGTSKPEKLLASPVSPAIGKDSSNPVIAMGLLKSQGTQRTRDFSTDKNMEPQRTPLSSTDKNKQKIEIWDSLGEPGRHGDFLVKYTPTPTTLNPEFPSFTLITESPTSSTSKNTHTIPTNTDNPKPYEASSSRKNSKKKKFDTKTLQETINEMVQDILKTMLPKYDNPPEKIITEDDSKTDSPVPSYLSCPNDNNNNSEEEDHSDENEDTNQSDDTFSFDSIARHNLDT